MKNAERIALKIIKEKARNILIHTLPNNPYWLISEKLDKNKWKLSLAHPERTKIHTLGYINNQKHSDLWRLLITIHIEERIGIIELAEKLKATVENFLQANTTYELFIKRHPEYVNS